MKSLAVELENETVACIAQGRGTLHNRVEHRLGVSRRLADDAQDLARRRLLLQGFYLALLRLRETLLKVVNPGAAALPGPVDDRALGFAFCLSRLGALLAFHRDRDSQELPRPSGTVRRFPAPVRRNAGRSTRNPRLTARLGNTEGMDGQAG